MPEIKVRTFVMHDVSSHKELKLEEWFKETNIFFIKHFHFNRRENHYYAIFTISHDDNVLYNLRWN